MSSLMTSSIEKVIMKYHKTFHFPRILIEVFYTSVKFNWHLEVKKKNKKLEQKSMAFGVPAIDPKVLV